MRFRILTVTLLCLGLGCKKQSSAPSQEQSTATTKVGLVTDVGGRGDQSFNDSALRGLELWAAGSQFESGRYLAATDSARGESLPTDLKSLPKLPVRPVVLQSKAQEDYEPNLQLLVDQKVGAAIAVGFMLENAVEAVAKQNPNAHFVLIDSVLMDAVGKPYGLPNVRTVTFKEQEGSFLAGALAGLVTKTGKVGFVGGMEVPLIKKFEVGFRAGLQTTNPKALFLSSYTGSFNNVAAGKQVAADLLSKNVDIVYHAAGSDGLGVIQAVKEARVQNPNVYVIGVDSDQWHLAQGAVLTSVVKRVDLAVYQAAKDITENKFTAEDQILGLKEAAVVLADVRIDFPDKEKVLKQVDGLKAKIVSGEIKVPARPDELASFKANL